MDESNKVAPGKTVLDWCDRALLAKRPYLMQERLETDAMLIDSPQLHPTARECNCYLLQQWAEALFESALCRWISTCVAWSWCTPPGAKPPQPPPAGLTAYLLTKPLTHPGCYRTSAPEVAAWRGPCQRSAQLLLTILRKERSSGFRAVSSIPDSARSFVVVPTGNLADPVGRVAGNSGNRRGRQTTTQKPEKVPATPLNRISSSAVAVFKLVDSEMWLKVDVSCQHG
jgi:hypothetical protein